MAAKRSNLLRSRVACDAAGEKPERFYGHTCFMTDTEYIILGLQSAFAFRLIIETLPAALKEMTVKYCEFDAKQSAERYNYFSILLVVGWHHSIKNFVN